MKAYVLSRGQPIAPFGDSPGDCLIANQTVKAWQEQVLHSQGLTIVRSSEGSEFQDPEEHLVLPDTLFFTTELLKEFISTSRALGAPTVCALKRGITTVRTFAAVQNTTGNAESIEYDLRYTPGGASDSQCQAVTIDADGGFESIPVPEEIYGVAEYQIPVTDKLIVQIDHWAALWAANIAAILYQGALLKKQPPLKLLWLAAKALSSNKWMVLSKANQVGRGCDIHPTAYIEGSIIGENVRVGAGTVIREAIIGSGTYIGNNNSIEVSVIGERCVVWSGSAIQFSVVNPGSNIGCRFLSASLVGRGSLLADGVTLTDVRLDGQNITVLKDGLAVDTENRVLGCCVGHRAYLGSGVVLAPGRIVPNGMRIASGEERVLASIKPGTVPKGYRLVPGNDRQ